MVKLVILFRKPADEDAFEARYNQNLALMEQMPGLHRRQACVVLGGPSGKSPYHRILELYFDDFDTLDKAMLSPQGRAAGADLVQFMGHDAELIFSEVFEE
jgi:uncharacterized protein (TIGR02118 family)